MPTTYNGIGTHYYGKKDWSTRVASCRSCGRAGELRSYETRLWFVVLFIPLIPLGRKRIIDECPSCRRHLAADAAQYAQARELQISGSLDKYRREATPESALEAHAQLLAFHDHDRAAELRAQVLEYFPDDARLRATLGDHMKEMSNFGEWARLHRAAHELDPDLTASKVAVAFLKMGEGEVGLDAARGLLDFLEEPGAGDEHDLGPLISLAEGYQKIGRHEQTLELAEIVLQEVPAVAQRHDFRAMVARSEKAIRPDQPLLPARENPIRGLFRAEGSPYSQAQRTWAKVAAGLVLAVIGLGVSNEYIRTHRKIQVLNACGAPVLIKVDGGPTVSVAERGELPVSEGKHHISIEGAVHEEHNVDLESGYVQRWSNSPLWILNPGGEAAIARQTIYYSATPKPGENTIVVGQPFLAIPHVDYAFEDPPTEMRLSRNTKVIEKVEVQWVQGADAAALQLAATGDLSQALDFGEARLRRHPEDEFLIETYVRLALPANRPRAAAFFKTFLARRPVVIPLHRAYQNFSGADPKELASEYDAMLAAEPGNAALLYLRGRVEQDEAREADFFRRSREAEPKLPWPAMAQGMHELNLGRWAEALPGLTAARDLGLDDPQVVRSIQIARQALGQTEALIQEARTQLSANPSDSMAAMMMFDALAASGHPEAIDSELLSWVVRQPDGPATPLTDLVRAFARYQAGRPAEAEPLIQGNAMPGLETLRAQILAATDRASQAVADPVLSHPDALADPYAIAAISLGLSLEGKPEPAAEWLERACKLLEDRSDDARKVAALLRAANPPEMAEIDRVFLQPGEKAMVLALLAQRFPERRAEYLREADRFNILRLPPYLVVKKAIEAGGKATP